LSKEQSDIFWEDTRNLKVFSKLKENLIRIVVPASETFELLNKLKDFEAKYFVDWGGNLIWLQLDAINSKILNNIKTIVKNASGYLTIIKIEEGLKASTDVFTIDPIKHEVSEKIKKSFDPRRILNPGKMYIGI
jgi:glycolate oxidase FAD binding subunit